MEISTREKALSAFLTALDGRDPGMWIRELDGEECIEVHNLLKGLDDQLKQRWERLGSPVGQEIL